MISINKKIRFYCFFFMLIFVIQGQIKTQEKNRIIKVDIQNLVTINKANILPKLKTQVDKLFSQEALKEDIQILYNERIFSNVKVNVEQKKQGVIVTFIVTENQLLGRIKIQGNQNIDTREIMGTLEIAKEKYLAPYVLSLDLIKLKKFYQKKGYQFVKIKTEKKVEGGWTDLYIIIDEGPEVTIKEINFFGNKSFGKSSLLKIIKTQEDGIFSSSHYSEDIFQEDLILLRHFYRSEGFLDVRVHLRDIFYSNDRTHIIINISIDEGIQYQIKEIFFDSNILFSDAELLNRLSLKAGMPFKRGEMLKDKNGIERLYGENGFLNVKVKPVVSFYKHEANRIKIEYKIKEGRKTYIRQINIQGNTLTHDHVIRREILATPGERFNLTKIKESQVRLRRLRYFNSIKLNLEDTGLDSWKDLSISVEEGSTGHLRFAAGITSDMGAIGEISLTKRNFAISKLPKSFSDFFSGDSFTGDGQKFDIFLQAGNKIIRYKISFLEPYFFGYNWIFGTDAYNTVRRRESWDEGRFGGKLTFGKRLGRDSIIKFIYRLENVDVDDVDDYAPRDVSEVEGHNLLSSFTIDFTRDTRDDFILPTRGYIVGLSYEVAGVFLGGEFDFSKINVRLAWFKTLYTNDAGTKHVLALGSRLGFIDVVAGSDSVPVFERFFAGGSTSIRGFKYRTVSPREDYPELDDDPIGGNFMVLFTAEYSFPIYQDILRGVLFTDVGNVVPTVGNDIFDSIRVSIGIGFRIKIPLLGPRPFAIDFGFPIQKEDEDDRQIFSFSFGKPF